MSDESSSEKTEQPTPKKLKDSRKQGQVAQSKDITMLFAIVTLLGYFVATWQSGAKLLTNNYVLVTTLPKYLSFYQMITVAHKIEMTSFYYILSPIILAAVVSFLVNIIQLKGIVLNEEAIGFKFDKLNPVTNFQQIFSRKSFLRFLKQCVEIIIMTVVAYIPIKYALPDILKAVDYSLAINIWLYLKLIIKLFTMLLSCYLVFGAMDFWLEHTSLIKQLMMTKQDIKKEERDTNGKPEIKQRQGELRQELMEEGMSGSLSKASFVLANPTHIAIVVLYNPTSGHLPFILLKVKGYQAQAVFRVAKKINLPIIRDKWLAREIFTYNDTAAPIIPRLLAPLANLIGRNLNLLPNIAAALMAKMPVSASKEGSVGKL